MRFHLSWGQYTATCREHALVNYLKDVFKGDPEAVVEVRQQEE